MMYKVWNNEKGIALPLMLIFVAAFSIIGISVLSMSTEEITMVRNYENSIRAFYLAERGLNEAIAGIMADGLLPDNPGTTVMVTYASGQTGSYRAKIDTISASATTLPRTVRIVAAAEVGQVKKYVEITAVISSQQAGNLTFANYAIYGDDIQLRTEFSMSLLWDMLTCGRLFGVSGEVFAGNDAYFGPLYRVTGSVNTGGNITLDSFSFLGSTFGEAVITNTDASHEHVNPDDYNYNYPTVDVAAYRQAADMTFAANDPAMVTVNGRQTLKLSTVQRALSGIVCVEGDIEIDSSAWITEDVTFFAQNGNIHITNPIATVHKVGLVASRPDDDQDENNNEVGNIDLGSLTLFGNNSNAIFVHAESDVTGSKDYLWDYLINYKSLNGTIIGRTINLANVRVNYNSGIIQNGENGPNAPPLPDHFGISSGRAFSNWKDIGISNVPSL
jgi:Tfp pilus assembly protein PilX